MKIIYGVCSLGLGHATRSLPLIKELAKENEITILSTHYALDFLKKELKDNKNIDFIKLRRYPPAETYEGKIVQIPSLLFDLNKLLLEFKKENRFLKRLLRKKKYDLIISDGRYGIKNRKIPSILISHQIRIPVDEKIKKLKYIGLFSNMNLTKIYDKIIVPDSKNEQNLSGNMSHNLKLFNKKKLVYTGCLSSVEKKGIIELKKYNFSNNKEFQDILNDLDYLFVVGGFLEEEKRKFLDRVKEQFIDINKKTIIVKGDVDDEIKIQRINKKVYQINYINSELRDFLYTKAKNIIGRTGYTTILDLVEIEKQGYLIPTKGQAEQKYLAIHLNNKKIFYTSKQEEFDIKEYEKNKNKYSVPKNIRKTKETIKIIIDEIEELVKKYEMRNMQKRTKRRQIRKNKRYLHKKYKRK